MLDRGGDVLIATPGRLLDVFDRGKLLMNDVKILVIDEADRMLDMGFIPDVERIVSMASRMRQTLFFSATMPPEIRRLADAFLSNPKEISVAPPATTSATVTQGLLVIGHVAGGAPGSHKEKREALRKLIDSEDVRNALIFCNRKRDVGILARSLVRRGYDAAMLHGDMAQSARTEVLDRFKRREIKLLVCSDVAARGLDIQDMSHVFNFDVPANAEDYVHRIGRTARAGREGRAFTVATPEDGKYVVAIEKLIGSPLPRITLDGMESADLRAPSRKRRKAGDRRPEAATISPAPDRIERREPDRIERRETPPSRPVDQKPRPHRPSRREAPDRPVVGMGDHVPAFMLREPKLGKKES